MYEEEAADAIFEQLVDGVVEVSTGLPVTAVRLLLRALKGFDERNPNHQRAAARAISRYIDYANLPRGLFDYENL